MCSGLVWSFRVLSLGVCCTCRIGICCIVNDYFLDGKHVRAPTHRPSFNRSTVSLRRDGLGIAICHPLRLPAEARCEIAQFRGRPRRAVRPLQPALFQEKDAPLLLRTRGDNLHTEHRDPAIKWCKSCPTWRARDQILQSASSRNYNSVRTAHSISSYL